MTLRDELVASARRYPAVVGAKLAGVCPQPLPERYGDAMRAHRLRREIIATGSPTGSSTGAGSATPARRTTLSARRWRTSPARPRSRGRSMCSTYCGTTSRPSPTRSPRTSLAEVLLEAQRLATRATRLPAPAQPLCSSLDVAPPWRARRVTRRMVSGMLLALLHGAGREAFEERVAGVDGEGPPRRARAPRGRPAAARGSARRRRRRRRDGLADRLRGGRVRAARRATLTRLGATRSSPRAAATTAGRRAGADVAARRRTVVAAR